MTIKFPYYFKLRVRYSEIDGAKIVFNAHYMTYVDVAMTEYIREVLGENWLVDYQNKFDIVLRKSTFEFIRPAYLDDILLVGCSIVKLGNTSYTAHFNIVKEGEEESILMAEVIYVNVDTKGNKLVMPQDVRLKIAQFEKNPNLL